MPFYNKRILYNEDINKIIQSEERVITIESQLILKYKKYQRQKAVMLFILKDDQK